MRKLAGAVLAAALHAPLVPATASPLPVPAVWAHRGGADLAPENTMAAFENAAALFTSRDLPVLLEMDTQLTADGTPVIIHDDTLNRTTTCEGPVIEISDTDLGACNAAENWPAFGFQPVPRAADVIDEARENGWHVMIEIKDIPGESNFDPTGTAVASRLVPLLETFPRDHVIAQSFWPPALDAVRSLDTTIPTMLLTTSQLPGAPPGVGFPLISNAVYATLRGYEISSPDYEAPDMSSAAVMAAHLLGREVITWTVDSLAEAQRLAGYGVDGVITNDPDALTAPVL